MKLNPFFQKEILKKGVVWILFFAWNLGVSGQSLSGKFDNGRQKSVGLMTEAGAFAKLVFFQRSVGTNPSSLSPVSSFFIGPGLFLDYSMLDQLALSAEVSGVFDVARQLDRGQSFQGGLFVKYFMSDSWGYVGAGTEVFLSNLAIGGVSVKETDIMLTLILTGENISIKDRINSTGNLRFGISVFNTLSDKSMRFYFAYVLGLGFAFEKK